MESVRLCGFMKFNVMNACNDNHKKFRLAGHRQLPSHQDKTSHECRNKKKKTKINNEIPRINDATLHNQARRSTTQQSRTGVTR
jgi:hypothetical protein